MRAGPVGVGAAAGPGPGAAPGHDHGRGSTRRFACISTCSEHTAPPFAHPCQRVGPSARTSWSWTRPARRSAAWPIGVLARARRCGATLHRSKSERPGRDWATVRFHMTETLDICPISELPPGAARVVEWEDLEIGIFNCNGDPLRDRGSLLARQRHARRRRVRPGRSARSSARVTARSSTYAPERPRPCPPTSPSRRSTSGSRTT